MSSTMIQEIKRIIKESEIMKCDSNHRGITSRGRADPHLERTTPNGRKRTRMDVKNLRSGWGMSTFPLRYELARMGQSPFEI